MIHKNDLKQIIKEEYHNVKNFMEEKYGFVPELGKVVSNPYATAFTEATDAEEKEFHNKLDKLVHATFGKSPDEEKEDSVNEDVVDKLRNGVQKINRKYQVKVSTHPMTKGEIEIILGRGNHPDSVYHSIEKLVKSLGIKRGTYSIFDESVNEDSRFSPMGYAKQVAMGKISMQDAMKDTGYPFNVLVKLVKKFNKNYKFEGSESDAEMAVGQLQGSVEHAQQLIDKLKGRTNLEPWVQALITKAEDYLNIVNNNSGGEELTEGLQHHVKNNIPLYENEYRMYSKGYFELLREARTAYKNGTFKPTLREDVELLESDLGRFAKFEGKNVPLDLPMVIKEAEYQGRNVDLNKPMRNSGGKKFKVYVKNAKGNIVKVEFGASGGGGSLAVKLKDPEAKKAFASRHNCEQTTDKTTAGYWACRLPRYAKSLGLSGGGQWW